MISMDLVRLIDTISTKKEKIYELIPRAQLDLDEIKESVLKIINRVKFEGDKALIAFTKEFDAVELNISEISVSESEIKDAYKNIDPKLLEALRHAKKNLTKFHEEQFKRFNEWYTTIEEGVEAGQIYRPLESVGIYVPGGRAVYPSTVLMAATPARVASVKELILCSPPQNNGKIAPEILVAASQFDITKIYKVGGAQAIAAMAYGTESIPSVQKIIGPGNKWVNAAKQLLSNEVAIDTPAGPSEICIIADDQSNYEYVIMDLLSQVEHDPDNIGILISDSSELIERVKNNLIKYIEISKRKEIIIQALKNNSLIIKAKNLDECIEISNIIAPEHLELLVSEPSKYIEDISNAGALFIGPYSPVPLGDYSAGTNHILPTGGTASKYSGLNVLSFLKIIDVLKCTKVGLKNLSMSAMKIAEFEGLHAHKSSIEERLKDKN